MSMEMCSQCGNAVDTDKRVDGEYSGLRYVCEWCVEMRDAEEYLNRMRQVSHEGMRP
jgi:predicted SprT family Zn-dependent metalloprotease